jgi:SNF2 family DNA or RNA helicase
MIQIVNNKALLLETPETTRIITSIKKSHRVDQDKVLVNWGLPEVRALAKLGIDAPSPILHKYKWSGSLTPFEHQKTTSDFLVKHNRAFCFSELGLGKTASVIWAADYLLNVGDIKRVLVVCPLSIMKAAWQQDIFKFAMHRSCMIAYGDAKTRKKVLAMDAEFVIINFDGLGIVTQEIIDGKFDLIVVDEATSYKKANTARWKTLNYIMGKTNPKLWMLTGTPAAQSPLDAYGLAKLVNPDTPKYVGQFRDQVMYKVSRFKWVPKPHAHKVVHKLLQPAIRFEKADCLDLPPVTHVYRDAPMTSQQAKFYRVMKQRLLLTTAGEEVSAVNAAVKLNKLLQIAGGSVYTDSGEILDFDVSNRVNAVVEIIEEASNKVLVFVPFTHSIELLQTEFTKQGISSLVINGTVAPNKRGDIVKQFQEQQDPRVLLIQPQAAAHGLTLTAADTIIWYAPVTSVEIYLQANGRINRPGQNHPMTIFHIRGSDIENRLYHMLSSNIQTHNAIIDLYKEELRTP